LTPARRPIALEHQAQGLAYPVGILGERAVEDVDHGDGDGLGKVPFERAHGA
jgi:hypothetical protein